jgi:hypothetical protein
VFPHQITVQWNAEANAYVARVPALDTEAKADTPEKAVRAVLVAAGAEVPSDRSAAAAALGRVGGVKGGAARAAALSKTRRAEIAQRAAAARWSKTKKTIL